MKAFKRLSSLVMAMLICTAVITASSFTGYAATKLTVFAAASMTESMKLIAKEYKKIAPDVEIIYNFDSSGTLKTQIEHGADCDVFLSAGQKQMDQLDVNASSKLNPKKLDFVMEGTRFNIVSNKVVLVVPRGHNPKGINDFKDVVTDKVFLIALGNSDVPVGQYSVEVFKSLGIWDKLVKMNKISYGSNVKEVLSQVAAGAVDCGVVYSTDAATSNKVEVVAEAPKGTHKPITYPAAILKKAANVEAAKAFVVFLKGPESTKIFKSIGFAIPAK